jgi:hypothetical protein
MENIFNENERLSTVDHQELCENHEIETIFTLFETEYETYDLENTEITGFNDIAHIYDEMDNVITDLSSNSSCQLEDIIENRKRLSDELELHEPPTKRKEQETRLAYLIRSPLIISKLINSGDLVGLKELIEDICLPECSLKTSATQVELVGREYVIKFFIALNQGIPDYVAMTTSTTLNFRVVSALVRSFGTKVITTSEDSLYDHMKHGQPKEKAFVEAKEKYEHLVREGKPVAFSSKSFLHLILNKEMTHVEKFVVARKSLKINSPPEGIKAL